MKQNIFRVLYEVQAATENGATAKKDFTGLDWAIMIIYMVLILLMGAFFYWQGKRSKKFGSSQYLAAKGMKVPAIVVGLSIWATALSSLTFLATPGIAFRTGWMWIVAQIAFFLVAPYLVKVIIPFYRNIKGSTAYAYLERRFHYSLRAIGSISFILFHIFRIAIVLYIPTLTLSFFIDINIYLLLFIVALVVVASTFLGGFKGVMWTDAIQGFVFLVGIVIIIVFGLTQTNWQVAKIQHVFRKEQWKISLASGGMFFIFIAKYIENLFSYTASQDIVQRYKTGQTISTAYKSIYINVILTIITILVFYGAGSVLYSYYSGKGFNVDSENAISEIVGRSKAANNQLLSYFIITVLPMGVSGLLISAIFAASQSTISSSLNSLVTSLVVDFIQRWKKYDDKFILKLSKLLTVIFGILGFLVAVLITWTKIDNLIQYFLGVVGLLGAPLAGLFLLGLLTKRTNWIGALTGILTAFVVVLPVWVLSNITNNFKFASEWLVLVSFFTTVSVGYFVSWIVQVVGSEKLWKKELQNLTVWTKTAEFVKLQKLEKVLYKTEKKVKKKLIDKDKLDFLITKYENLKLTVENQTN